MSPRNKPRRAILAALVGGMLGVSFLVAQQPGIFKLLRENDLTRVRALLDADPLQVNAPLENGLTPLMAAVALGNRGMAEFLISRGAVIRSGDDHLRAPIHYANWREDRTMVELLLAHGAPVDTRAIGGATPLIHASFSDRFEMCRFLIEKGADIHIQCNALTTPLYFAVLNGNLAYTEFLLDAGAEVDVPDFLGRVPLTIAVRDGNRPMAEILAGNGADLFIRDRFLNRSLLHLAAIEGHADVADFLLNQGLAVNETDEHGSTPLDYARRYGHPTVEKLLRERGAKGRVHRDDRPGKDTVWPGVKHGTARIIKMQNGSWGVSTAHAFFLFGYSEIGAVPAERSLRNGHLGEETSLSGKRIFCIDHDFHPERASHTLQGSNPLVGRQDMGSGLTFLLNPTHQKRYAPYGLKHAYFMKPEEPLDLPGCRFLALPSYGGNSCTVVTADGLVIVWLTGICDNYMVNRRDTGVIEDLRRRGIRPDILLVGSPTGIGPEVAHGIRETVQAAEPLDAGAVFVLGHEPLERKVFDQLRRKGRDTGRIRCADNPGDEFLYDPGESKGKK